MTFREVINQAKKACEANNIPEQHAILLLLEMADMESHNLYYEYDNEMDETLYDAYQINLNRLLKEEPLAHIVGNEMFCGYRFKVNEDVLIPRPETEELVYNVLQEYDTYFEGQKITLIDIGTGSGAIAISLKKEEDNLNVYASDISEKAIVVAKENANKLDADVTFYVGDMVEPFIENNIKVDILVSNPPYIPQDEQMERSVVDFEPHVALFGGEDGLKFYRMILENAHKVLNEKSILAFEMGYNQKENMTELAKQYFPNAKMECKKDLQGKNRMFFIFNNLD